MFSMESSKLSMAPHKVLLLGATGETGGDILEGLVEDGGFVSGDAFISSSSCFFIVEQI
jgi:hypothetical protein